MPAELGHEALAEAHDLCVGLALGVEVGAALAAAHGQRGQAVLENLLEAEELEHAEVDRLVEAQAALVGAKRAVELNAETAVDVHLALVVCPGDAEHDDALGLDDALEELCLLILGVCLDDGLEGLENLGHGLDELRLVGVFLLNLLDNTLDVTQWFLLSPTNLLDYETSSKYSPYERGRFNQMETIFETKRGSLVSRGASADYHAI